MMKPRQHDKDAIPEQSGSGKELWEPESPDNQLEPNLNRDLLPAWIRRSPLMDSENVVFDREGGLTRELDW